MILIFFSLF